MTTNTQDMTDFELNLAIAELVFPDYIIDGDEWDEVSVTATSQLQPPQANIIINKNYCNNWNDLMPLVVEHGMSLNNIGDEWMVYPSKEDYTKVDDTYGQNPQKALAETLYLVLKEKAVNA